ncbi:tetratricopeptide repeat protein [Uliginosibacterium sp. 31-16]|uniref:tetratricopeptide repeat protein n=1 Tax=Uliginosibacterium sp. 31-16 TaxID=3068315 RepID=UPI00273DC5D0|nr:tetratricopeptide repeat protein [Uliginosibacterium sp. 31-16]MDP5241246.1 tetratricopeptide repeat protein [Uliginosibacterium sp. 31-16]
MNPQSPVVFGLLSKAFASHQAGRYVEARQLYQAVLQIDPRQVDALHLLGLLCSDAGDDESAVRWIGQALTLNPGFAAAHVNLGLALRRLGRHEEALETYDRAIAIAPDVVEAHFNRGNLLRDMGRTQDAFESFLRVVQYQPEHADALNNCGSILWKAERYEESIDYFDRALVADARHVDALVNKASSLEKLGKTAEALPIYDCVLEMQPEHIVARVNRGSIFEDKGLNSEALGDYLLAQKFAPDIPDAHWNEALCRLKIGEYEIGWKKYEWRWKGTQNAWTRNFQSPQWQGESLNERTILLHAEQGFGDTLQFCRYASLVAGLGAKVILEVQPSLVSLLGALEGVSHIVARGDDLPEFDVHCPLMSLPRVLQTTLDTIPSRTPYVFPAEAAVSKWRGILDQYGVPDRGGRIGIVWDTVTRNNAKRRVALERLVSTLGEKVAICVLQKEVSEEDKLRMDDYPNVFSFEGMLQDFGDTAALVSLMDVVVSIDTGVAHLAGSMAKPVIVMLPYPAEWRWLQQRDDSPWYPTARLLRQTDSGDWSPVLKGLAEAIKGLDIH